MFDVKVSANTPAELTAAIVALAAAMQTAPTQAPVAPPLQAAPTPAPTAQPVTPPAPVTPPTAPPAPPAAAPAAPPAVPLTGAPVFTREQIMSAGAALIDAGKMGDLMTLLNAFGVQAVTQLKQEQLGTFATEMRKLGAQI